MKYELLLRPIEQGGAFSRNLVLDSLSKTGFDLNQASSVESVFELKENKLMVRQFIRSGSGSESTESDGKVAGLNLEFSLGLSRADADMAVAKVFELSQDLGAIVFDPQAGRQVRPSNHNLVMETWQSSVDFQADVVGAVTMGGSAPELLGSRNQSHSRLGLYLLGIILLLAVVYLARKCASGNDASSASHINSFTTQGGDD